MGGARGAECAKARLRRFGAGAMHPATATTDLADRPDKAARRESSQSLSNLGARRTSRRTMTAVATTAVALSNVVLSAFGAIAP